VFLHIVEKLKFWPMHTCWLVQVYALGFVSVFDQVLDGFEEDEKTKIFTSYVKALGEDPAQYRVSIKDDTCSSIMHTGTSGSCLPHG